MQQSRQNIHNMMGLDLVTNPKVIDDDIHHDPLIPAHHALQCWDMFAATLHRSGNAVLRKKEQQHLNSLGKMYGWNADFENIFLQYYEALVLTDRQQHIIWVNDGFFDMTGYTRSYAIGKTPGFLQGTNTSSEVKSNISLKLNQEDPFTETIINYRKSGEAYLCDITIYPLLNSDQQITHYLALECEVSPG